MSLRRAAALQSEMARYVSLVPMTKVPRVVAGIDSAERDNHIFVAIVVMDMESDKVIEITHANAITRFQYVSGYRSFRHSPVVLKAYRRVMYDPDLLLIAGHGVCHPRFFGIASHLGLLLDKPTIGVAETRLVGHFDPPAEKRGKYSIVRFSPQAPAAVLRTREGVNPIFVSPGHKIDLLGAIEHTLRLCTKFRMPEPLRRAHIEAGKDLRRTMGKT